MHFDLDSNETPEIIEEEDECSNELERSCQRLRCKEEEFPRDQKEIFVYALCDRSLSMLNYEVDFIDKEKAAIKPIFLLLHVPEEKENLPNIRSILFQIYSFLSLVSDIRVVILDKTCYNSQIKNMSTLFNIVDRNIEQLIETNIKKNGYNQSDEEESESECRLESESLDSNNSSLYADEDADFELNLELQKTNTLSIFTPESLSQLEVIEGKKKKQFIYSDSKIIFLINDQTIQETSEIDEFIDESEFFTEIKGRFHNKISLHYINTDNHLTYKGFLDHINDICMSLGSQQSEMKNNFKCIDDVSHLSSKYISLNELDEVSPAIKQLIYKRYESLKTADKNVNPLFLLSFLQDEINTFSPAFDLYFRNTSQSYIDEIKKQENRVDCEKLKRELNQSATEKLEKFNYQLHQRYFWTRAQIERIKRSHFHFLETEYVSILKIIGNPNITGYLYEENIDILNEQKEKDRKRLDEIFAPFVKRLELKETPKEEEFEDVKRKGTSYIMTETESIREVKVTLETNTDLKTIIEQDF